jgi:hypothetical protein
MSQLQRAIQRELDDFIKAIREPGSSLARVSKGAFCKARNKLKHGAFIALGEIILEDFYSNCPFRKTWKGYRLISTDGSTAEVPNSEALEKEFGVHTLREDGKKTCLARICEMYDPLNNLSIAGKIGPFVKGETALVWDILNENKTFGKGDIFIFDRAFYSSALAFYLHERGTDFCFRVKRNWGVVKKMVKNDDRDVILELTLHRKSRKRAQELGVTTKKMNCRLVWITLESGEEEFLLTSLTNTEKISVADLKELYFFRWGIEEKYKKLKHKVCIENFSGKSVESVYQDYYAKLFIINLTSVLIQPVDRVLEDKPKKKFVHKVNYSEALAKMKFVPLSLFIKKQIEETIAILHQWFLKTTEPIRPGRKFKRPKLQKRKYPQNYKPV